jgi:hypothetical protein
MSATSPSLLTEERTTALSETASRAQELLQVPVRALAFWSAVVLPFGPLYLLIDGLTGSELLPLLALLVLNAVALVLGHDHRR